MLIWSAGNGDVLQVLVDPGSLLQRCLPLPQESQARHWQTLRWGSPASNCPVERKMEGEMGRKENGPSAEGEKQRDECMESKLVALRRNNSPDSGR